MKRIFALVLSLVFLLSCLVLPAGAMFDPSPVYQVQAASAYIVNTDTNIIDTSCHRTVHSFCMVSIIMFWPCWMKNFIIVFVVGFLE